MSTIDHRSSLQLLIDDLLLTNYFSSPLFCAFFRFFFHFFPFSFLLSFLSFFVSFISSFIFLHDFFLIFSLLHFLITSNSKTHQINQLGLITPFKKSSTNRTLIINSKLQSTDFSRMLKSTDFSRMIKSTDFFQSLT